MSEHKETAADLTSFEAMLAALTPSAGSLDRDRVIFLAGRSSAAPRRGWLMPLALSASLLLAAMSAGLWWAQRAENQLLAQRLQQKPSLPVVAPAPSKGDENPFQFVAIPSPSDQPSVSIDPSEYLALRNMVLKEGVEALPRPQGTGNSAPTMLIHIPPLNF